MRTPMSNRDFNKVAKQAFFLVNSPKLLCLFVHFLPSKHRLIYMSLSRPRKCFSRSMEDNSKLYAIINWTEC